MSALAFPDEMCEPCCYVSEYLKCLLEQKHRESLPLTDRRYRNGRGESMVLCRKAGDFFHHKDRRMKKTGFYAASYMLKPDVIRREFELPEELEPVNILAVGYSDEAAADPGRHVQARVPLEALVSYETIS